MSSKILGLTSGCPGRRAAAARGVGAQPERIRRPIAHMSIVLSLSFAACIVLDFFNPLMAFTSNEISTPLLAILCLSSLVTAVASLRRQGV
ncbi:MAG TPA: hypothetical protein IAD14_09800 [Candidatus Coprousia avicola]|nr:hypothetical protein [Candidatus Coprousia avicola]